MAVRPLLATALLLTAPLAPAATLIWPAPSGSGPCAGTLQACVDAAAAGDTVLIGANEPLLPDAYTAINEPVVISKSLTLAAAPGIDAVFGPGFNVGFQPTVPGPHQVTISGLVLRPAPGPPSTPASSATGSPPARPVCAAPSAWWYRPPAAASRCPATP